MNNENDEFPLDAWVNCREIYQGSLEYGNVVVQEANIWDKVGSIGKIASIPHGSKVRIIENYRNDKNKTTYFKISTGEIEGWVSSSLIARNWATFAFFGSLVPSAACKDLARNYNCDEMNIRITQDRFSVITEGDPEHFDAIQISIQRLMSRISIALATLTSFSIQAEFSSWIEIPFGETKQQKSVGFILSEKNDGNKITNLDVENAFSFLRLMNMFPYFELALNDYSQALKYSQHALIFLARAIESIENHFGALAKISRNKGKEKTMVEELGITKADVTYITKKANDSHRRHASSNARIEELPGDELDKCFSKTLVIIMAFKLYLEKRFSNIL